jgi:hypothetical protein
VQVGTANHVGRDRPGDAFGLRAVGLAREHTVEVLAVERIHVGHALLERLDVREPHEQHRAAQRRRIDTREQALRCQDRHELEAVHAGGEREHRPGLDAMEHRHRHARGAVGGASRHGEIKVRPGAGSHRLAGDGEGRARLGGHRMGDGQQDEREDDVEGPRTHRRAPGWDRTWRPCPAGDTSLSRVVTCLRPFAAGRLAEAGLVG